MMDLNKHIVTNDSYKPFHSNGFAQIANGNNVGSVGRTSFEQRRLMDRNRQVIDGYRRSNIGNTYGVLRAKPVDIIGQNRMGLNNQPTNNRQGFNSSSTRNYNPFA